MSISMKEYPPVLLIKALILFLKGKVHFSKRLKGKKIDEKTEFIVFRKVTLKSNRNCSDNPVTTLRIYFKFARFSPKANKLLSAFPIPLIISQKGFISKTWLYEQSNERFQGFYEWENATSVKNYMNSFVIKLMKNRSLPGSFEYEINEGETVNE